MKLLCGCVVLASLSCSLIKRGIENITSPDTVLSLITLEHLSACKITFKRWSVIIRLQMRNNEPV